MCMKLPYVPKGIATIAREALSESVLKSWHKDYLRRRASLGMAYAAWLLLGWHYLYLGRVGVQFAFWVTLWGFIIWWLIDLFRVPSMVNRYNEDAARQLLFQYKTITG